MKAHPFADVLPLLEGAAFNSLVADIRANGLLEPITIHEGLILDGRNRYRACEAAGIEPQFLEFDGDDPLGFVLSLNVHRRHLSESQRSLVASRLATMRQGERTDLQPSANLRKVSQAEAAKRLNVSQRSVTFAALVEKEATPELVRAVEQDKIRVSVAAGLATAPEAIQRRAVAEPERAHVFVKQERQEQREVELAGKIQALPDLKAGVLYADPPWRFEVYSRDTGLDRDASNHYPVQVLKTIKSINIASIAADECALFLWATVPMLPQAIEVMRAWGFVFKSGVPWVKDRPGTGYWFSNQCELLLLGTRGSPPVLRPEHNGRRFSRLSASTAASPTKPTQ